MSEKKFYLETSKVVVSCTTGGSDCDAISDAGEDDKAGSNPAVSVAVGSGCVGSDTSSEGFGVNSVAVVVKTVSFLLKPFCGDTWFRPICGDTLLRPAMVTLCAG